MWEYFEELTLKTTTTTTKSPTLNDYISKKGSFLKFSESSFNFLQTSFVFCMLYTAGDSAPYPRCRCPRLSALIELVCKTKNTVVNLKVVSSDLLDPVKHLQWKFFVKTTYTSGLISETMTSRKVSRIPGLKIKVILELRVFSLTTSRSTRL